MSYELFETNTPLIRSIVDQAVGYIKMQNICLIFPRSDFGGSVFKYEPQLYFGMLTDVLKVSHVTESSLHPIIDTNNNASETIYYNRRSRPISFSGKGKLRSLRDSFISKGFETILGQLGISQSILQFNSVSVALQIGERHANSVPYSFWHKTTGFLPLVNFSNFEVSHNCYLHELDFSFSASETRYGRKTSVSPRLELL